MSTFERKTVSQERPGGDRPDDDAVQRAKREIQGIIQGISEASRSGMSLEKFFDGFLNQVVAALAAAGGAVWLRSDSGVMQLIYQINLRQTGLIDNPIAQSQHGRLLQSTLSEPEGTIVAPHSGAAGPVALDDETTAANPTDFLLVLAPVHNDQGVQGMVEIFQHPRSASRPAVQRGYLRFLLQACELASDYLRGQRLRHLADKQSLWEQLESFTRTAHNTLDVRETAYTIANEGRRLVGCDRVTLAVQRGSKCVIEAISGQDVFDKRSNVATLLTKLARAVAKTGEDVWYTGDTTNFAPQVEKALNAYVDESHTKHMAILPLILRDDDDAPAEAKERRRRPPRVLGALVVEQMVDSQPPEGYKQRVDVVRTHSTTALANSLEHEGLFLMPLWKTIGKMSWLVRARTLPKTLLVTSAIVGFLAWAFLWQWDFTLEGDGKFRPAAVRNVFARVDGEVVNLKVDHDTQVKQGDVLVELKSLQLQKEIERVRGELETTIAEQQSLNLRRNDRDMEASDQAQIDSELRTNSKKQFALNKELELLDEQRKLLTVTSPIDGRVITFDVKENLGGGRPVHLGDVLMEVADPTQPWRLEVMMPDKRMGHIEKAWKEANGNLEVTFIPATTTEASLTGKLVEIGSTAETRDQDGNTVKLIVEFDQAAFRAAVPDPKVDASAIAKVHCGKRSVAYWALHDLVDFLRVKVWFRLFRN
jgi:hypothetical protein